MPKPNELRELQKKYKKVFAGSDGKAVLDDINKRTFKKNTSYFPGATAIDIAYAEGVRSLRLHIENMMNLDVDHLEKLQRQAQSEEA